MVETVLRLGLENRQPIEIIYDGERGITRRRIRVIRLEGNRVVAWCYEKKAVRSFQLERILGAMPAETS